MLGFLDAFLLSIDTQTTIGFGNYAVDSSCVHAVVILVLQCLVSVLVDAGFMGLLFAKISQPTQRASTVVFSQYGCISEHEGERFLCFRIADLRKHQLVEARVRLLMYFLPAASHRRSGRDEGSCDGFVDFKVVPLALETADVFLLLPYVVRCVRVKRGRKLLTCSRL